MGKTAVGREIERLRKERGFTQVALAKACGVSNVTIFDTEQGNTILEDHRMRRVAQVLNVDPFPLLELAALDRGTLAIRQAPRSTQRLVCRLVHGQSLSEKTAAKLAAILDSEPVAAA